MAMKRSELEQIIEVLPEGRTEFAYRQGDFVFWLLRRHIGTGRSVRSIKRGPFGSLLKNPSVRRFVQQAGNGVLSVPAPPLKPVPPHERFTLSLGRWGRDESLGPDDWYQTCRPGYNLVLLVNFPDDHNKRYQKMFGSRSHDHCPFEDDAHPHCRRDGCWTMAWVRLDVDLDRDVALIEEIQSDWIRQAHRHGRFLGSDGRWNERLDQLHWYDPSRHKPTRIWHYLSRVMPPLSRIWAEATFAAALWFLQAELGIRHIYCHSWDSCRRLKVSDPPRFLYQDLPRRFCFAKTTCPPPLFTGPWRRAVERIGKARPLSWWTLSL
ncbi:MAG: hypothetical protein R3236_04865 [Phycisphaeraceae bacterium]|nr:hypothetical protein [Phycisphaeraceae bacterium]